MSNYVIYYNTRKYLYRDMARSWKAWADTTKLTSDQSRGMSVFFRHIGKRFGLITEFKNIGVI
jgi:hypothetical protein